MDSSRKRWKAELEKEMAAQPQDMTKIANYKYLLSTYTDSYHEKLNNFFSSLPNDGDLMLLFLKGHLLIEQQVRAFVYNHFPNQKALKNERWEASTVISMGRAHCDPECSETMQLWDCFKKLNNIRNHMAHNIDHTGLEHKIDDFLKVSEKFTSFGPNSDGVYDRAHNALNAIYQKALYLATKQESRYQDYEKSRT